MAEQPVPGFADVLRRLRADAGLTQEELAEAARLSPRTVSDLERGVNRTAHKDTAELLADALGLAGLVRGVFVAAARGRALAAEVLAARAEALDAFAGNLPVQVSSFIGRDRELSEVRALVASSRLVTLTGTGGCGKTRLSLQVAAELLDRPRDGVWLVELAAVTGQDAVAPAICEALAIVRQPGRQALDTLLDALATQDVLIVIDNCEHLIGACAKTPMPSCGTARMRNWWPPVASRSVLAEKRSTGYRLCRFPDLVTATLRHSSPQMRLRCSSRGRKSRAPVFRLTTRPAS